METITIVSMRFIEMEYFASIVIVKCIRSTMGNGSIKLEMQFSRQYKFKINCEIHQFQSTH